MRPSSQDAVDVPQGRVESRLVVPAVVVDPAADVHVEHPRQVVQRLVAAFVKRPASDRLPDRLESLVACRRAEQDAEGAPPAARQPRPEGVAEKVELLVRVVSAPVVILAEDDSRLLGMKRQPAFDEPPLKRCAQRPRLLLCQRRRENASAGRRKNASQAQPVSASLNPAFQFDQWSLLSRPDLASLGPRRAA